MSKKDFNEGTKLGLRLSENTIKSNTESIEKMKKKLEKVEDNTNTIIDDMDIIIKTQEEIEIEKSLGVTQTFNLEDLEKEEKIILFQILDELGKNYKPNENQKKFKLNLLKYLNITPNEVPKENKIANFRNVLENLDNIKSVKIIYQTVCEYLYLDENNLLENYSDILSNFYFDYHFKKNIETKIEANIKLYGIEILYKQFLIKPNTNNDKKNCPEEIICLYEKEEKENMEISQKCALLFFGDTQKNANYYIETLNFIIYPDNKKIIALNKITLEKVEILKSLNNKNINSLFRNKKISSYNDLLYIIIDNNLYYYNLNKLNTIKEKLIFNIKDDLLKKGYIFDIDKYEAKNMIVEKENVIYEYKNLFHYNLKTQKNFLIKEKELNSLNSNEYFLKNGEIYFVSKEKIKEELYSIPYVPSPSSETEKFSIKKYILDSNFKLKTSNVLLSFIKNTNYAYDSSIEILKVFSYNIDNSDYMVIILKEESKFNLDYKKYLINLKNEDVQISSFPSKVAQIEKYKNFFIYNNISENFKIQKYNIFSNDILTLTIEYSIKNKDNSYELQKEYRRIGKWIFDEINNRIIDIEK